MPSSFTSNFELEKQQLGDHVDTWGDPVLNQNVIDRVDAAMGATTSITLAASPVTLTLAQWRSKIIRLTGTISANITVSLPLSPNSVGSATAVGGEIVVDNQTTGNFTVTINTAATSSTGVQVPQGYRSTVCSDGVNVVFSDDEARSTINTYAGNPNGNVAGTAGSNITPATLTLDRNAGVIYATTTSGDASTAVHSPITGATPPVNAYVTTSSDPNNVVQTGDAIGATTIYVSNYGGNTIPVNNGSYFIPVPFSQLPLALTASQAGLNLYDVVFFLNNGVTPTVGFSPSWLAGSGGSITAGSCARGTGVGGAAIQRVNGVWQNTAAMTVNNGVSTYSVGALRGTILASIFVDSSAGQVTCHRTFGQSRKWGIANIGNRQPIGLKAGAPTSSWNNSPSSNSFRNSDGSTANSLTVFNCVAEEQFDLEFVQFLEYSTGTGNYPRIAIGVNSNSSPSGKQGRIFGSAAASVGGDLTARLQMPPALGINTILCLESNSINGTATFYGTESNMYLSAQWSA